MAKNWSVSEAVEVIQKGLSVDDIQDISKRFPLLAHNAAKGEKGLATIIASLSEKVGALTIERKLKEVYGDLSGDSETEEVANEEVANEEVANEEKPKARGRGKAKSEEEVDENPKKRGRGKAKKEEVPDEDEFEDFDDEDEEEVKPKSKTKGKGKTKPQPEPDEDEEDDEWEDEDEDEDEENDDGLEELSSAELKKLAKANKVSIAGLKNAKDIIAKLRAKGVAAPGNDEDEEDEDDWDI